MQNPPDRHKWFFSLSEAKRFLDDKAEKLGLRFEDMEAGLPQTRVLLWVAGEQLKAVFENVILAEYHCRYDWQDRHVKDLWVDRLYQTRFASPQGTLIPLTPQECLVVYRAKHPRLRTRHPARSQQLLLFELVSTG